MASNYAGLTSYVGANRGTGWNGGFSGSSSVNAFLGSSGQIDTSGIAFGVGNGFVSRSFGAQSGSNGFLTAGQIFQFRLQPGTIAPGGQFAFSVATTVDLSTQARLQYTSGEPDYVLMLTSYSSNGTATTQTIDTGVAFTGNALAVDFNRGVGSFTLSLTPTGGATTTLTTPYTGNVLGCNFSATNGTTLYFNNIAVVPEPGSAVVLVAGAAGLGLLARLRRRSL